MNVLRWIVLGTTVLACIRVTNADESAVRYHAVQNILAQHCYPCHGPDAAQRASDLRLDKLASIYAELPDGGTPVVPGDRTASSLFQRISNQDETQRMPPADFAFPLTEEQIALLGRWIDQGAPQEQHWFFRGLRKVRQSSEFAWGTNPIDQFTGRRMRKAGFSPAPEAEKETLIRRLTLDLIGLPPTPAEVDRFLLDDRPAAYERLVDHLLASPSYGEKWSAHWLDAARYADTHGYLFDTQREMWRWRDWVIQALNENMPFDQFVVEQLAGDLLAESTFSQKLATGFNRNHIINNEAGATPAEYYVENIVDRVNTTATVFLGLTLQCCQCHDHKYDPLSQVDYYRFYAFFDKLQEAGLDGLNENAKPKLAAPTESDLSELALLESKQAAIDAELKLVEPEIARAQSAWEQEVTGRAKSQQEPPEPAGVWALDGSPTDSCEPHQPTVWEANAGAYADGLLGKSARFDGLAYLNGGARYDWDRETPFTLSVWLKLDVERGRLGIVSRMKGGDDLFRGYTLQVVEGQPALFLVNRFPDNMLQVQAKEKLKAGRWYHLAATHDGSGKASGVGLWLDGKKLETGIVIDKLSDSIRNDSPFWIGNGHPGAKFRGSLDELRVYPRPLSADEIAALPGLSVDSLFSYEPRSDEQQRRIRRHFLESHAPQTWREQFAARRELQDQLTSRRDVIPTVMVMRDEVTKKKTRLLVRGAFDKPGAEVEPGTPESLPPFPTNLPRNRLGLATWLTTSAQAMTSRVAVNRCWQHFFGTGFVATSDDFGVQGAEPTHPLLLDWLAEDFVEHGWNVKRLHRMIVTSSTYRQSAHAEGESWSRDPANRWLSRGPRLRLSAEAIRDQALAVSGLLVERIGGASVKPYQPEGLWREVAFDLNGNLSAQIYEMGTGAALYRRSLYTFWKRTSPPPALVLFDAPTRERCVVRRPSTNTPLQALALMNEPTFVEAARRLADQTVSISIGEGQGDRNAVRLRWLFRRITGRFPEPRELGLLHQLLVQERERFDANVTSTAALMNREEATSEAAAFTVVANMILALDETISKP